MDEGVLVQWGTSTGGGKRWYLHGMGFKKTGNCMHSSFNSKIAFQFQQDLFSRHNSILQHVIVVCVCVCVCVCVSTCT